jgi:hypothetical protein
MWGLAGPAEEGWMSASWPLSAARNFARVGRCCMVTATNGTCRLRFSTELRKVAI